MMGLPTYITLGCCVAFHPHSPGLTTGKSVALCVLEQNPDHVVPQLSFPYGATHFDSLQAHTRAQKREG